MGKYKIIPSSRTIVQSPISIGHKAEKGVEAIEFDVTAWVETYGSGTLTVIMRRWGDAIPYPIALEIDENNKATWTLSDIDTAKAGMAYAQLNYIVGETVVKKSDIYTFRVMDSLTGEGDPPEAYESWLEHLTHFAAEAMAEVLDIEGIVTDKTLTVDGGIADAKATGEALAEKVDAADYRELSDRVGRNTIALAEKADRSTTYTKTQVDQMISDVEVETDTTLEVAGAAADAAETGRQIGLIKDDLSELISIKAIQQSDLVFTNSNFVVSNGKAYAVSVVSPYNCMAINAKRIDFKYRRRSSSYQLYIGVAVDGKFVGNRTNVIVSEVKTVYDTINETYSDATVNASVADDSYSNNYNDYSATLTGQVFELKKGDTTILKFTVASDKQIQGIAILNYRFDYYSTTDNTDFKDGEIVTNTLESEIANVDVKAEHAEIIGLSSNHRMVAGVIRNAGSGWEFIINDRHQGDMNCLSVGIGGSDGRLYIDYSGINVKKVISLIAAPDEAFANRGYVIGASVGLDKAYIQIYQYALQSVSAQIRGNSDGTFSVESADGVSSAEWNGTSNTLDITHDSLTNKVASTAANVFVLPCFYGNLLPRLFSISATKTRIEFIDTTNAKKVTTPGTNMSINFSRYGSALARTEIDPATLVSTNGNIWFMGIFEV